MNFLTRRLLTCLSEEESFWVLIQIVEQILPPDYYSNLVGVLVDQKVLQSLITQKLPKLAALLEENHDIDVMLSQKLFK